MSLLDDIKKAGQRATSESSIFGSSDVANVLPQKYMPDSSMRAEDAYQLVSY